jgi:hypothetical protein
MSLKSSKNAKRRFR